MMIFREALALAALVNIMGRCQLVQNPEQMHSQGCVYANNSIPISGVLVCRYFR